MPEKLTLERGQWYGWTMWPGYTDQAYHSPIQVIDLRPLGKRQFQLEFFNLGYAEGVQGMTYTLQTLKREPTYLLAAVPDSDRAVAIEPLTMAWLSLYKPNLHQRVINLQRELSTPDYFLSEWLKQQTATADS